MLLLRMFSCNSGGPGYAGFLSRSQRGLAQRVSFLPDGLLLPWGAVPMSVLQGGCFSH